MLQQVELYIQAAERELHSATASITQFSNENTNNNKSSTNTAAASRVNPNSHKAISSSISNALKNNTSTNKSSSSPALSAAKAQEAVSFTKKAIGLVKEAIQTFVDDVQNWKHDNTMIKSSPERVMNSSSPAAASHHSQSYSPSSRSTLFHHQQRTTTTMMMEMQKSEQLIMKTKRLLNMTSASASSHPLAAAAAGTSSMSTATATNNHNNNIINTSTTFSMLSPVSQNTSASSRTGDINNNMATTTILTSDLQKLHDSYEEQREKLVSLRALHRWTLGMYRKQYEYATVTLNRRQAALENVVDHSAALGEQFALRRRLTHVFFGWCTWAVNQRRTRRDERTRRSLSPPSVNSAGGEGGTTNDEQQQQQQGLSSSLSSSRKGRLVSPSPLKHYSGRNSQQQESSSSSNIGDYFQLWISNAMEIFSSFSVQKSMMLFGGESNIVSDGSPSSINSHHHSSTARRILQQQYYNQQPQQQQQRSHLTTTTTSSSNLHYHQKMLSNNNNNSSSTHSSLGSFSDYFSSLDSMRLNSFAVSALLEAHESVRTNLLQCAATTTSCNYMMFTRSLFLDEDDDESDNNVNNKSNSSNQNNNNNNPATSFSLLVDSSSNPAFGHIVKNLQRSNSNNSNNNNNQQGAPQKLDESDPLHQAYMVLLRHNYKLRKDMRTLEGLNSSLLSELQSSHQDRVLLRKQLNEYEEVIHSIQTQTTRMRDHSVLAFLLSSSSVSAFVEANEKKMELWLEYSEQTQINQWRDQERKLEEEMLILREESAAASAASSPRRQINENDQHLDSVASSDPRGFWRAIIEGEGGSTTCLLPFFKYYLQWKNIMITKFIEERNEAQDQADVAWSRLENLTQKHAEVMAQVRSLEKQNQSLKRDAAIYQDLDRMNAAQDDGGDHQYNNDNHNNHANNRGLRMNNNNNNNNNNHQSSLFPANIKNMTEDELEQIVRARCFRRWSTYVAARLRQRVYEASVERSRFLTASVNDTKLREMMIQEDRSALQMNNNNNNLSSTSASSPENNRMQAWAQEVAMVPVHVGENNNNSASNSRSPIRTTLSEARVRRNHETTLDSPSNDI